MTKVPSHVLHEAFDDETVVVNMKRGHYFAFSGKSANLWSEIVRGASMGDATARLDIDSPALDRFMRLLDQEGLVESSQEATEEFSPEEWLADTVLAGSVERFTDIEGLLLIDPIHEFDQNGWPTGQI
ncbi:MAG: hypothetical protein WCP30_10565 [Mycobacteriaceae bacterium]